MQRPGFWDDREQAAEVSSAHARAQKRLESFRSLESDAADLEELAELAEGDPEIAAGLDSQLSSIEARLAELEEARLFAGEYDSGDAVVTVRSGPAAPTRRTGPRCCCGCTCDGRSVAVSRSR